MKLLQDFAKSSTVWGVLGMLASILNMTFGMDISPEVIEALRSSVEGIVTGVAGVVGFVVALRGRKNASGPLGDP